ncbi:MAG: translation initiation factor IF-2 [candidate division KSB1 bacterium]|nr:translation initiation factor IF-2 [candidate division KSB1 bacterium]
MAVKKRVFQVAREFSISNEALIEFLTGHGYDIRNHMSPIADDAYAEVQKKFGEEPVHHEDSSAEFRKRLRDKQSKQKEASQRAKEDLEQRLRVARELAEEKPRKKHAESKQKDAEHALETPKPEDEKKDEKKQAAPAQLETEKPAEEGTPSKPRKRRPKRKLKIVEIPPEGGKKSERGKKEAEPEKKKQEAAPAAEGEKKQAGKGKQKKKPKQAGAEKPTLEDEKSKSKGKKKKRRKKRKKPSFDEQEIQDNIKQTLASIEDESKKSGKRKKRKSETEGVEFDEDRIIKVSEFMPLADLARRMEVTANELIVKCMELGMMVTINQRLDMETIELVADEFGYTVEALSEFGEDILEDIDEEEEEANTVPRAPVVTIMGHVDHGKTSLLDYIRESNIIGGESGGITQHMGAYEVKINDRAITFLDTPGHEAFTAMRARGAQVTDIVILVVAADDSVMPQTIEAISHSKAAGVPIIVAINKVDKPNANPDMIRKQLADHDVLVEEWGGKTQTVEISAKHGQNIEQLLELVLLEAEILELKSNPGRKAKGAVIDARLDRGKGVVSTVLVQNGTLHIGDPFIAGKVSGKVRSMFDERGDRVDDAGPSRPVQVLGLDGIPQAGDTLMVLDSERDTRGISQKRQQLQREHDHWQTRPRTLDEISQEIQKGQVQQLSVVIKADVDGSIEAIADALVKLATDEVAVNVIHKGVGAITESDVLLASASGGVILGFHVRPSVKARELAKREHVDIRSYNVIYDLVEDVKSALEGFLAPTIKENNIGTIEVRQTFKVPKVGVVAGCYVMSGRIHRNHNIKLYRDDRLIHEGTISSLKRFTDDVREVASGYECGLSIDNFNDIKVNDVIESYEIVEEKRTL